MWSDISLTIPLQVNPRLARRLRWLGLLGLLALAALVWAAVLQRPDGRLHLYVLDVGQGDALLLTTPGDHAILVDGGPDPARLSAQLGSHLPFWRHSLDLVVLTHPHEDHIAGLIEALRRYDVGAVLETPYTVTNELETAWLGALHDHRITPVAAVRGGRVAVEPGLSLDVLAPDARPLRGTASDINNASVVLRCRYGQVSLLLGGDIETDAGARLLAEEGADGSLRATVLKVPHHGSATGLSERLLAAIRPQVALISVGAGNDYGQPAPETLAALAQAGVPVYRTDLNGTVEVTTDGARLWVQAER